MTPFLSPGPPPASHRSTPAPNGPVEPGRVPGAPRGPAQPCEPAATRQARGPGRPAGRSGPEAVGRRAEERWPPEGGPPGSVRSRDRRARGARAPTGVAFRRRRRAPPPAGRPGTAGRRSAGAGRVRPCRTAARPVTRPRRGGSRRRSGGQAVRRSPACRPGVVVLGAVGTGAAPRKGFRRGFRECDHGALPLVTESAGQSVGVGMRSHARRRQVRWRE